MDLIRVLGCGMEMHGKGAPKDIPYFDINRLSYNKVIITCDQDVDGEHIITLLVTMIHKLCPQLIQDGYLYIAQTPLYEITDNTGRGSKTLYAFSDAEKDRLVKGKDSRKIKIQRSKGLGENDAGMMSEFLNPATRKLIRVTPADAEEMERWFDLLMGNNVAPRKKYIEENGHLYSEQLDLS